MSIWLPHISYVSISSATFTSHETWHTRLGFVIYFPVLPPRELTWASNKMCEAVCLALHLPASLFLTRMVSSVKAILKRGCVVYPTAEH